MMQDLALAAVGTFGLVFVVSYLIGSIPWAYIIVKQVTGEDITQHGTGNVGAMNVRRTTESWGWFAVDVVADGLKGLVPVVTVYLLFGTDAAGRTLAAVAMIGAVVGHNWSVWMSLLEHRVTASGKGLATGGGALLAYDWRYLVVGLVIGLAVIALTRYSMAGQVAATLAVPLYALATRQSDWPLILILAAVVYVRHHRRFVGLLQGREPRVYTREIRGGPRG
jgi:acyl phosphate:glycerol-3-phosphate acyltransferase